MNVIVEIKGQVTDEADVKAKAADRWVKAVNQLGTYGERVYIFETDPGRIAEKIKHYTTAKSIDSPFELIAQHSHQV